MPADERHEVGKGQAPGDVEPVATPFEQDDVLVAAFPDRLDEAAARRELFGERRRHTREGRRDEDGVEGRLSREASAAPKS